MIITKIFNRKKVTLCTHHGAKSIQILPATLWKKISCTVCMIYHLKSEAQTRHSVRYPFSIRLIDKLFQCQSQQLKNRRWMYRIFLCLETPAEGQQVKNTSKNGWWFRRENHLGSTYQPQLVGGISEPWTVIRSLLPPRSQQKSTSLTLDVTNLTPNSENIKEVLSKERIDYSDYRWDGPYRM